MRKKIIFIFLLFAAAAVCFFLLRQNKSSNTKTAKPLNQLEKTSVDKNTKVEQNIESAPSVLQGIVVPSKTETVVFKLSGELEVGEVNLKTGSTFLQNQLLFQLNNSDAFRKLQQIKSELNDVINDAIAKTPSLPVENLETLRKFQMSLQPVSLIDDLPEIPQEFNTFRNDIIQLHLDAKKLEAKMSQYFYLAPFDGKVTAILKKPRNHVRANETVAELASNKKELINIVRKEKDFNAGENFKVVDQNQHFIGEAFYVKKTKLNAEELEVYYQIKHKKLIVGQQVFLKNQVK